MVKSYTVKLPDWVPEDAVERWQRAIAEMTIGYTMDPGLGVVFQADHDEVVISRGIEFSSLCEHHLFPFFGTASVAYIPSPGAGIVGLSKLARTVEVHSLRLQTQERMGANIATDLEEALRPVGTAVIIKATHTCQKCRGIRKDGEMVTSVMRGAFREDARARAELMGLLTL